MAHHRINADAEKDAVLHRPEPGAIPQAGALGRWIDRGGIIFAIGIILAMLILIQEVILRYVFGSPTIWAHETTIFLCGIAFVYGGLYCTARDRHIRVVLLYDMLSPPVRRSFDIVISLVCAAASAMFAWASWTMVARSTFTPTGEFRLERSGSAWDPMFPGLSKIFLLVVMGLMAIQLLILAWNYAKGRK
ncbi:TRAP transporter small permease [Loktanella sp. IMCC34160]|uniref:TRAP transporter small permease subunit n=1 Tax=Loktanella sp. IMCC34160 TaxID=2510646 RepID=UPI00101E083D|nr:TRAP transporter small permease [Loktanella sp. IMCC34160]RYG93274.1 TRAP transporter small permease [Loktanella sp. IMCC34160]